MTPFELLDWPCPAPGGGTREELAVVFDRPGDHRVLVLPALFDEANKLRRQTIEVMRRLALSGVAGVLPDLPGCNESTALLAAQSLASWRDAAAAAAAHFSATHVLALRGGALLAPAGLPGWRVAATDGARILRGLVRARTIAAREAGHPERSEDILARARSEGIELAGWHLGAEMVRELESAVAPEGPSDIPQTDLGGPGLWLRAEPDEAPEQADSLAAIVAFGLAAR